MMIARYYCYISLLLAASLYYCEAGIIKRQNKRYNDFKRTDHHSSPQTQDYLTIKEIEHRLRRDTNDPHYKLSFLNDTNTGGLVHYSGNDSKVVFVLTYSVNSNQQSTNVYRSNDYGYTFNNINTIIGNGATLASVIYTSPENPKRVYFADASQSILYLSTDEGISFTKQPITPSTINTVSFLPHPTVEDWVLALDTTNNILYVSRDFGKTPFKQIANNVQSVQDYQWGEKPYDQDNTIVYYNTDSSDGSTQVDLYTQQYPYDDNTRKEFDPSLGSHDGFLIVDRYLFAQKTVDAITSLWVSADRKPFKQAVIPSNYNHLNYLVDSIRSLQALVIVQHDKNVFNLYMSEEYGYLYYLALSDIVVEVAVDLETVASMNYTTFIANQNVRDNPEVDDISSVRTLISYDVGANWNILTPPTDTDTECIQPLCSLHLHMSNSEYWRTGVYSQESAPGIIIAHGIIGQSLNNDDNTNLFISRDGGVTWSMTLPGTWGISILDRGSLIIAALDYHADIIESNHIMYTCDEGLTWRTLTFNVNIKVFAVITEPGETTTVASLFGAVPSGWAVVTIQFSSVFLRTCTNTDYYYWTPFDQNTDTGCLLGATVSIERQKPSVCCLNGKNYNRQQTYSVCPCSEEDYECDYGYKHANGYNGPCVRDDTVTLSNPCGDGDLSYMDTQGYHKIGGDVCIGGEESLYGVVEKPCCLTGTSNSISIILGCFVLIAIIIIGVLATILVVCVVKHNKKRSASSYRLAPTQDPSLPDNDVPTYAGVQNINYTDDDETPLAP